MLRANDPVFARTGVRCVTLDELIGSSDVVSLHVPLVDSTRNLFDATRIAALDVFASEPLGAGNTFGSCPNLLLTPHIAGVSSESNERVSFMIAQQVLDALA